MTLTPCIVLTTIGLFVVVFTVFPVTANNNHDCMLPTVPGMCMGYFPRFSYHPDTKSCTQFIYGGCRGNANNFRTYEECNKACVPQSSICSQPTLVGPCKALIRRFSYHPDTKQCTLFYYGGCRGNQNNFPSLDECNKACVYP